MRQQLTPRFAAAGNKRKLDGSNSVRNIDLLSGADEVEEVSNAGCRGCRYYLQTSSECLKENRRGELMRTGLAGMCNQFKEIQRGRCCFWCEKEGVLYEIDAGHIFCSENCESDYYQDRQKRMKTGKPPLLLERRLERGNT